MPEISRFMGIVIRMHRNDHNPPHFHAVYNGMEVSVNINTLQVIAGEIPRVQMNIVKDWAKLHQKELMENWKLRGTDDDMEPIEPYGTKK